MPANTTHRAVRRGVLAATLALAVVPAALADALREGSFKGLNNHKVSGTATVVERDGEMVLMLSEDFSFDGAPDPKIAFGPRGQEPRNIVAPLKSDKGPQSYTLPDAVKAADSAGVYVWCERYSVPLGYAAFE
jgi:hypothetical protein